MHNTLILPYSEADTDIIAFINSLRRRKKPFTIQQSIDTENDNGDDEVKTTAIRERLRLKYVLTGEWSTMDDDERQDAALLESMLYDDENGLVEILEQADAQAFYHEMKSWAK